MTDPVDPSNTALPGVPSPSPALVAALTSALRPIVRLLIRCGVTFPAAGQLLKAVYVDVADREFLLPGRPQTDSRISVLTGVHRKDVHRLRRQPVAATSPAPVSLGSETIGRWLGSSAFCDASGRPLPLPRTSRDGEPSFERLVQSVSTDVRPRVLLDEWLAAGVVRVRDDGCIVLVTEAFVPRSDFDDRVYFFGRNLRDHAAAAVHNVTGGEPPFFERAVFYDRLRRTSVAHLQKEAAACGMETLVSLNRKALALAETDEGCVGATHRITIGLYVYAIDEAEEPGREGGRGQGDV